MYIAQIFNVILQVPSSCLQCKISGDFFIFSSVSKPEVIEGLFQNKFLKKNVMQKYLWILKY